MFGEVINMYISALLLFSFAAEISRVQLGDFFPTRVTFSTDLDAELGELLQEFQDVVEELKAPSQSRPHAYQQASHEAKCLARQSEDSGVDDSDYSKLLKKTHTHIRAMSVIKIISA